jgi:hypothetical protein
MKHTFMGLATLLGSFMGLSQSAQAQGNRVDDALLFSRQGPSGTARTLGIGGANVALGGDFGSLSLNPAGLGFFTKSEISFTPGVGFGTAKSTPVGNFAALSPLGTTDETANSFHIASAGVVFASRRPDTDNTSDWRGGSFALGFTRLADFNQGFAYTNQTNDQHSFFQFLREPGGYPTPGSDGYVRALNDITSQDNSGSYYDLDGLAYGNFLTTIGKSRTGLDSIGTPVRRGPITQREQVLTKGSLSQFDLGYGGNYRDKLYIGFGLGIVSLNRTRTSMFSESSNGGEDFSYQDYLKTTGTGINARLGLIYRVADAVRVGASVQTPTYIRLTDAYSTTLTSQYAPQGYSNVLSTVPDGDEYSIMTPFRANGGVAVLVGKYGFLTGDIEYVGYSQARFKTVAASNNLDFTDTNQAISSGYQKTVNLRFGAEGRVDIFRARVGYARYGNPYAGTSSFDRNQNYYTAGLGIRTKSFFVDAAGVYMSYKDQYSPYSLASNEVGNRPNDYTQRASPLVNINQNRFTVSLTGGLLF